MAKATAVVAKKDIKSFKSPSALHPSYSQMISEAISALKERNGSSQPAIAKAVEEKHGKDHLPPNFKKLLSRQLKKLVKAKRLVKVKNSYKIASPEKAAAKKKMGNAISPKPAKKITSSSAKTGVIKTKRLSQVKTPEGLKKKKPTPESAAKATKTKTKTKTKPLSQVKTPEGLKGKITKAIDSSKPTKKARK